MDDALTAGLRALLGLVFLSAGIGKLLHRRRFAQAVLDFRLLSPAMARVCASALPWLEVGIGLALLAGLALVPVASGAALLLLAFSAALAINLRRGNLVDCQCSGLLGSGAPGWGTLARNGVLLSLALALAGLEAGSATAAAELFAWNRDRLLLASLDVAVPLGLTAAAGLLGLRLVEVGLNLAQRIAHAAPPEEGAQAEPRRAWARGAR
jgi:uncharacterized membrane protein YphA (DoxX/SURF4 family)